MYELIDTVALVAHNEIARVVYLIHSDLQTVSVFLPDLEQITVVKLDHEVERFTHYKTVTCLHGKEGATVLLGDEVIEQTLSFGPHRFLDGKLLPPQFGVYPDVRGEEYVPGKVGNQQVEKYMGEPVCAERYRGFTMVYFQDNPNIFSVWGEQVSPAPENINIHEKVLGEIYTHSHLRLTKIAVQDGWILSVDDGKYWRFMKQDGWPIALADKEVWLVKDRMLFRRDE